MPGVSFQSRALGEATVASIATPGSFRYGLSWSTLAQAYWLPSESFTTGVGTELNAEIAARPAPRFRIASMIPPCVERTPFAPSAAVGDGTEVYPLPSVRSTDARSAKIDRPDGITLGF